ncbi:dethiobiotin synthase [Rhodoferax sp.]|uniref:dethiobiotin synthase n=1 Tax=Rhodoferax sp. TaxID=50421 RepID=UPI00277AEA25|nr:dethiobiotin synthase [Rhodoferax sp.]
MTRAWFVTGTDTGVGKTLVSAALLHALALHHPRVVGMKPVAAGAEPHGAGWANDDVLALRAASTVQVPPELDNPVLLPDPLSPHIAARRAGVTIDIDHIASCYRQLRTLADAVVVEGAGGFLVPLGEDSTGADLAQALALPVLLVVGLRLGCLNHSLLTLEAIRARGLVLAGWVANHIDPLMQAQDDNIAYLQRHLRAPMLARIPFSLAPDPKTIAITVPPA